MRVSRPDTFLDLDSGLGHSAALYADIADIRTAVLTHEPLVRTLSGAAGMGASFFCVGFLHVVASLGLADHAQVFHNKFLL